MSCESILFMFLKINDPKKSNGRILLLAILLVLIIIQSCTYSIDDESFNEIKQGTPRPFTINFSSTTDTLYIGSSVVLNFDPPNDKDIIGSRIFIGGKMVAESQQGIIYQYLLDPNSFPSGYTSFKIEYYQKSKSGSLADKLNSEFFTFSFNRTILIDNAPSLPLKIIKTAIVDSTLVIYWEPFKGYKFSNYEIAYSGKRIIIKDKNIDHIEVPEFGGGQIDFNFYISAKGLPPQFSLSTYRNDLNFKVQLIRTDSLKISWTKSPFKYTKGFSLDIKAIETPINSVQVSYSKIKNYSLVAYPITFPYNLDIAANVITPTSSDFLIAFGINIKSYFFWNVRPNNFFEIEGDKYLNAYSNPSSNQLDYVVLKLSENRELYLSGKKLGFSPDGTKIFNCYVNSSNQIVLEKYSTNALSLLETIFISPPLSPIKIVTSVNISNDDFVFIIFDDKYLIFNLKSNSVVKTGLIGNLDRWPKDTFLSKGGGYLLQNSFYLLPRTDYFNLSEPSLRLNYLASYPSIHLASKNQYLFYDSNVKGMKVFEFLGSSPLLTIPVSGKIVNLKYNEKDHVAVLLKNTDGSLKIEVYNILTGKLSDSIRLAKSVTNLTDFFFTGKTIHLEVSSQIFSYYFCSLL